MPTLAHAIERLYEAFSTVPRPTRIEGCPHCIEHKGIGTLLKQDLRSITPSELSSYAFSAFLTVGDIEDYLYFLPRILEISATDLGWIPDPQTTGRAIRETHPENWSADRQHALHDWLHAVILDSIQTGNYWRIDDWICAIARIGLDVRPYLEMLAKYPAAVLDYFETNAESLPRNELSNAYWELPDANHDAIVDWFFSPEIAKVPFEAYGCSLTRSERRN